MPLLVGPSDHDVASTVWALYALIRRREREFGEAGSRSKLEAAFQGRPAAAFLTRTRAQAAVGGRPALPVAGAVVALLLAPGTSYSNARAAAAEGAYWRGCVEESGS